MELSDQLSGSHSLTAPVHPPERDTGPPELHHLKGRYLELRRPPSEAQLQRLEEAGAAAIVFHSLFEEQLEREQLNLHHLSMVGSKANHSCVQHWRVL
jgi:hypothetical protein